MPTYAEYACTELQLARGNQPRHAGDWWTGGVVASGWRVLGEHVLNERLRRNETQREFSESTGLSIRIIGHLEKGDRDTYDPASRYKILRALRWEGDSIEAVVAGGKPTPIPDPLLAELHETWIDLSVDARRLIVHFAKSGLPGR